MLFDHFPETYFPETHAKIREDQAKNEPIRVIFQDEARFGRGI